MGIEAWEIHEIVMLKWIARVIDSWRGGQLDMNILVNWLNSYDQFFRSSQQKEDRDEQW